MKLSDLKKLATAFENSDWEEIHLVSDGVEIHLSTQSGGADVPPAPQVNANPAPPARPAAPVASAPAPAPAMAGASAAPTTPATPVAQGDVQAGGTPVLSPTPGIFWRSPSPGAPPFVEVGQRVEPDTTICIVEVMKLMNRVPAGVAGTVVAVLVGNGEPVERDQPLVLVAEGH